MNDQHQTLGPAHLSEDDLVLHYYAETRPDERARADAHLAACEPCRSELTRLKKVLALVDAHVDVAAPAGFERVMWARVQSALPARTPGGWRAWLAPRRLALARAAATFVLAAFVAGRWSGGPAMPTPDNRPDAVASVAPDRVLLVAVGDHLERSQMVLVELLNADAAAGPGGEGERERAADLVAANRLIRQSADLAGESSVADVLDDLERVLIQIANGEEGSAHDLELLKARIESRGILFRMRVVTSEVRNRERGDAVVERAPVS